MSEWLAYQFLQKRYPDQVDEACWVSSNRSRFFGGSEGDDAAGFDFKVVTSTAEWLYEVKSALDEGGEFEITAQELRVAAGASKDGKRRYRILYVPFVFDPDRWSVLELPNPLGDQTRKNYPLLGRGSLPYEIREAVIKGPESISPTDHGPKLT